MPSSPNTFRLKDLPPEIFKLVLGNVDKSDLAATRSTCKQLKEETDDHFYTTFFTALESDLTKHKLESLVWLSEQSHLASHIKSLLFSIDDDLTPHPHHGLVGRIINNIGFFSSSVTLGVASQKWNHPALWDHCREMIAFLTVCLVPLRNIITVDTWKVVVKVDDLRLDPDWNLQDCFCDIGDFIDSELSRNVTVTQDIEVEIHDGAGDPVRHVKVTKNAAWHVILKNFDCEMLDDYNKICSLDDAGFTDCWKPNTLTIKDSVFLQETLRLSVNWNPSLRHLILDNVRIRRYNNQDHEIIEPGDWLDTLQRLQLGNLETCRLANLYDANGDFFVEGV